jgi:hypothetical protein
VREESPSRKTAWRWSARRSLTSSSRSRRRGRPSTSSC